MKYEDLMERVNWGEEFSFEYLGDKYWISQNEDGNYLTRVKDGYSQEFTTVSELFERASIDGKTIFQLWDEIEGQF